MESLRDNIIKKYKRSCKKYIKDVLMKKGFIKTDDGDIMKLDVFNDCFTVADIESMIDLINGNIPNFWNIPADIQYEIVNDNLMELLPVASISEIENYVEYIDISKKLVDHKQLDQDVKDLLKSNGKNHKAVFSGGKNSPEYQSQALINRDVIYCKSNKGYYRFDKDNDKFIKLSADTILSYVKSDFKDSEATKLDIMDYMKVSYFFFVVNSNLPVVYNNNKLHLELLNDYKADFDKVNKIVSNFE